MENIAFYRGMLLFLSKIKDNRQKKVANLRKTKYN